MLLENLQKEEYDELKFGLEALIEEEGCRNDFCNTFTVLSIMGKEKKVIDNIIFDLIDHNIDCDCGVLNILN